VDIDTATVQIMTFQSRTSRFRLSRYPCSGGMFLGLRRFPNQYAPDPITARINQHAHRNFM
jgi:hypothetical protein